MVFTGKPSTGCATCKKRRIKCDEARPRCGQCIKSKRECSGYTNRIDLMFRDETKSTEQRIFNTPSRSEAANPQKSRRPIKLNVNTAQSWRASSNTKDDDGSVPQSPTTDLVEQATLHFLANFVTTSADEQFRGPYSYLAPLVQSSNRPYFTVAFQAVALASLSSIKGDVERQALAKYTKALSLMASAIQDPSLSQRDDLLAASLLLALYETISNVQFGSMAWGSHFQGTIALCRMRSGDMLKTKQGRDLMTFIKEQYLGHFFTNGKIDPAGIAFWMDESLIDDVTSKLQSLAFQLGVARAEANKYLQASPLERKNVDAMMALIEKYKFLDRQFLYWSKALPDSFRHKSIQWDFPVVNNDYESAEVFPGKINIFS